MTVKSQSISAEHHDQFQRIGKILNLSSKEIRQIEEEIKLKFAKFYTKQDDFPLEEYDELFI